MMRTCLKRNDFLIASVLIFLGLDFNLCIPVNLDRLPVKSDVNIYLNAIERLLKTCQIDKTHIDFNLYFGLVLLNVNVKHALINKGLGFPKTLETTLKQILDVDDSLLQYYEATHPNDTKHPGYNRLLSLFKHRDSFFKNLGRYDSDNHEVTFKSKDELEQKYSSWSDYKKRVSAYRKPPNVPTPDQSDKCLASLAGNSINHSDSPHKCNFLQECYDHVANGTEIGYPISHRLLALIGSRIVWGCYIFSPRVDEELTTYFCVNMFDEAQHIAANGLEEGADLLMEQVALCSLFGHAEFLQRSWLDRILKQQMSSGCFHPSRPPKNEDPKTLGQKDPTKHKCDKHYTATVAGALGAAMSGGWRPGDLTTGSFLVQAPVSTTQINQS